MTLKETDTIEADATKAGFSPASSYRLSGLVERRAHNGVVSLHDYADGTAVTEPGPARYHLHPEPDSLRFPKPLRIVDRRQRPQRHVRADAGHSDQEAAHRIFAGQIADQLFQSGELEVQDVLPPQDRLVRRLRPRVAGDQRPHPGFVAAISAVPRAVCRLVSVLGVIAALQGVPTAHAEPGATAQWLMDRPLTLWDIGMIRLKDAAEEAADIQGMESSIRYIWDDDEIEISVNSLNFKGALTHEKCNEIRRHFIGKMFLNPYVVSFDDARTAIGATLDKWFSHEGFRSKTRDKRLGEKLSQIIFVEVHLSQLLNEQAADRTDEIQCRNRVTEFEAPSTPHFLFKPKTTPDEDAK